MISMKVLMMATLVAHLLLSSLQQSLCLGMVVDSTTLRNTQTSPALLETSQRGRERREWIEKSLDYYAKVMRGAVPDRDYHDEEILQRALRHFYARHKIKTGEPRHAEQIFRKIIEDTVTEMDCDHPSLAVPTLLLALLLQREKRVAEARAVFQDFTVMSASVPTGATKKCACCARVYQAYALFEMKQGDPMKSLELINTAISMNQSLAPVLRWKQFQDAARLPHY